MTVHKLYPLVDPRWPKFLAEHHQASVFHTREWLNALRLTYSYQPVAFTTSEGGELSNAVVFCQIESWLTGKRLVSLPFSDHCQPLAGKDELEAILKYLDSQRETERLKYIELRPLSGADVVAKQAHFADSEQFSFQQIDLRPEASSIYRNFHESCIRRKIKRADREALIYESGRSDQLQKKFRHLLLLTRRRHKLPPQPASWLQNIVHCLGNMVTIHVLSKNTIPVAGIVTLTYKKSLVYKYGCSDAQFNNMGGTPLLFWTVIQQAKEIGLEEFDLGRSGYMDPGLIAFKEHLGAISSELRYYRNPISQVNRESSKSVISSCSRQVMARVPDSLLTGVGQIFYRHIG